MKNSKENGKNNVEFSIFTKIRWNFRSEIIFQFPVFEKFIIRHD